MAFATYKFDFTSQKDNQKQELRFYRQRGWNWFLFVPIRAYTRGRFAKRRGTSVWPAVVLRPLSHIRAIVFCNEERTEGEFEATICPLFSRINFEMNHTRTYMLFRFISRRTVSPKRLHTIMLPRFFRKLGRSIPRTVGEIIVVSEVTSTRGFSPRKLQDCCRPSSNFFLDK